LIRVSSLSPNPNQHPLGSGLPGPKKLKRPNLAISSFKKGQILKNEKRLNKGQISLKKFVKITNLEFRISKNTRNLLRFVQNMP